MSERKRWPAPSVDEPTMGGAAEIAAVFAAFASALPPDEANHVKRVGQALADAANLSPSVDAEPQPPSPRG